MRKHQRPQSYELGGRWSGRTGSNHRKVGPVTTERKLEGTAARRQGRRTSARETHRKSLHNLSKRNLTTYVVKIAPRHCTVAESRGEELSRHATERSRRAFAGCTGRNHRRGAPHVGRRARSSPAARDVIVSSASRDARYRTSRRARATSQAGRVSTLQMEARSGRALLPALWTTCELDAGCGPCT